MWRGQVKTQASVQHICCIALTVDRGESVDGIVELLQSVRQVLRGCAVLKLKVIGHHKTSLRPECRFLSCQENSLLL